MASAALSDHPACLAGCSPWSLSSFILFSIRASFVDILLESFSDTRRSKVIPVPSKRLVHQTTLASNPREQVFQTILVDGPVSSNLILSLSNRRLGIILTTLEYISSASKQDRHCWVVVVDHDRSGVSSVGLKGGFRTSHM